MTEQAFLPILTLLLPFIPTGGLTEGYTVDYQLLGGSLEQFTLSSGWSTRIMVRRSPLKHLALCLICAIFGIFAGLSPVIGEENKLKLVC